jgi:hypothetical protein
VSASLRRGTRYWPSGPAASCLWENRRLREIPVPLVSFPYLQRDRAKGNRQVHIFQWREQAKDALQYSGRQAMDRGMQVQVRALVRGQTSSETSQTRAGQVQYLCVQVPVGCLAVLHWTGKASNKAGLLYLAGTFLGAAHQENPAVPHALEAKAPWPGLAASGAPLKMVAVTVAAKRVAHDHHSSSSISRYHVLYLPCCAAAPCGACYAMALTPSGSPCNSLANDLLSITQSQPQRRPFPILDPRHLAIGAHVCTPGDLQRRPQLPDDL